MITSETSYKLAEIIRDTWPNLYRPAKMCGNKKSTQSSSSDLNVILKNQK
jgi:hypothetical protein